MYRFDYGEKFWIIKWKQFTCACGSPKCKYSKETIHTTIADFERRQREEDVMHVVVPWWRTHHGYVVNIPSHSKCLMIEIVEGSRMRLAVLHSVAIKEAKRVQGYYVKRFQPTHHNNKAFVIKQWRMSILDEYQENQDGIYKCDFMYIYFLRIWWNWYCFVRDDKARLCGCCGPFTPVLQKQRHTDSSQV